MRESIRITGFDGSDLKERLADLYSLHEEYVREQASLPQTDDTEADQRARYGAGPPQAHSGRPAAGYPVPDVLPGGNPDFGSSAAVWACPK